MDNDAKNILIIGGHNAGKTHFGGQLYGRLNSRQFEYKLTNNRPADLTIFEDVLNKLAEGKRAEHTELSANRSVELKINHKNIGIITFSFPDYGGEQVKLIVENRRINSIWKEYIDNSTSWVLFIRIEDIEQIEDIINRGIPNPEEIKRRSAEKPPVKISGAAYFVELLQILLFTKGSSFLNKISNPKLTIVLSCWDLLRLENGTKPSEVLRERLPLLYSFIFNSWQLNAVSVIGLSSTEKSLTDNPDDDFIDKTPLNFGYIIDENGQKDKDLTLSIGTFIGKK